MFEFTVSAMVRGYHVYQEVWEVCNGEILPCIREIGNCHDPYVITVKKDDIVVGHLPQKFPVYVLYLFGEVAKYVAL